MRIFLSIALLLSLAAVLGEAPAPTQSQSGSADYETAFRAVTFLRIINTVEVRHRAEPRGYADFDELVRSGELQTIQKKLFPKLDLQLSLESDKEPLPGYEMRFILSGDAKSYSVLMRDKENQDSFYTDESGLNYKAKPIQ